MKPTLIWLYPRMTKWMGGSRFVHEVVVRLARRYRVHLVVQRGTEDLVSGSREAGVEVHVLDEPSYTDLAFWFRVGANVRRVADRVAPLLDEGTVLVSGMFPMNLVAHRLARPHVQVVYEPFAMFHYDRLRSSYSSPLIWLFSRMVAVLHKHRDVEATAAADVVLVLSEYERGNVQRVYGRDASVIYEGVDVEHFHSMENPELSARYQGHPVVFHSTGYDAFKGTDLVIEAIPQVLEQRPDVRFLISHTRVDEGKLERYRRFLAEHRAQESVEFLGFVDYALLPAYYTLAQVYVEPGYGRSMSLSSKEANACGTPSIRGDQGTEDVAHGETGLLTSTTDAGALADNILRLLDDSTLRDTLGENARRAVLERYLWDQVAERVSAHVETVAGRSH